MTIFFPYSNYIGPDSRQILEATLKESFGNTWGHSWGIRLGTRVAGGPRRRLKPALQPPQWPRLMKSSFANPPGALHGAVYRGMARHLHMKTLLGNLAVLGDVASLRITARASHASEAVSGHPRVSFGARSAGGGVLAEKGLVCRSAFSCGDAEPFLFKMPSPLSWRH